MGEDLLFIVTFSSMFILGGIVFLILPIIISRCTEKVSGVCIEFVESKIRNDCKIAKRARILYEYKGISYDNLSIDSYSKNLIKGFEIHQPCTIYVNPKNPDMFVMYKNSIMITVFRIVGIIFIIIGILIGFLLQMIM